MTESGYLSRSSEPRKADTCTSRRGTTVVKCGGSRQDCNQSCVIPLSGIKYSLLQLTRNSIEDRSRISPFLQLPPELRNKIYDFVFRGEIWQIYMSSFSLDKKLKATPLGEDERNRLALLSVCRQIHFEAALLPFKLSTFESCRVEYLMEWIDDLTRTAPKAREAIAYIQFLGYVDIVAHREVASPVL